LPVLYGWLVGPLLAGCMLFDKASLPGLRVYGIYAVHDFAVVYFCLFAVVIAAALERSPEILERLITRLNRFVPWLVLWLPVAVILDRLGHSVELKLSMRYAFLGSNGISSRGVQIVALP
jgi:hypothetical protein